VTWLGTSSGTPTRDRNISCTLVRLPGAMFMVDCGEGSHRQARSTGLNLEEVRQHWDASLHDVLQAEFVDIAEFCATVLKLSTSPVVACRCVVQLLDSMLLAAVFACNILCDEIHTYNWAVASCC
jgi:hypothetical protein